MKKIALPLSILLLIILTSVAYAQSADCGRFVDSFEVQETAGGVVHLWIICDRHATGIGTPGWGPPVGETWEIQELEPRTTVAKGLPFPCTKLCSHRGVVDEEFKFELLPQERWEQTLGPYVEGAYFSTPHNKFWGVRHFDPVFWADRGIDPQVVQINNRSVFLRTDLPGTEFKCNVTFRVLEHDTLPYYWKTPSIEFVEIFHFPPDAPVFASWPYGSGVFRVIQGESSCRKHQPTLGYTWEEELKEQVVVVGSIPNSWGQTFIPTIGVSPYLTGEPNRSYP